MAKKDMIIGAKIVRVRKMTNAELRREGWDGFRGHEIPTVVELDTGVTLFASRDDECNGPGTLLSAKGADTFYVVQK